ncbi:MAG TPA: PQQ-dependent dehydrogenase, methanol/ethanol family [Planctomycetaceae bacterium]|nr:PQQ-dependent dehydrogenase, methanol/ethanol family [Planctomycetaceae bacterium]
MTAYRLLLLAVVLGAGASLQAQVTFDRILRAAQEPHNWLTYSGDVLSQRHSQLTQITPDNVRNLELQWVFQARSLEKYEATSIVVDGVLYTVQAPNDVVALDAVTGRVFWTYAHTPSPQARPCCGRVNRGLASLGETLFMATIDARLIAIDAKNGRPLWNVAVEGARPEAGYAFTLAPLVVKDKVIIGTAGGEYGIRGFLAAFDARTGREAWRFYTIPGEGEPGNDTWAGDSWKTGGAPIWLTGSYDPESNLTYWGTGNPGPDWNGDNRGGDNLYSNSVVALDADTGKMKWHFQFSPHDEFDYDAVQVPVLADMTWQGRPTKVMLWANRNGFFYVLDRLSGDFLLGKPFVEVSWASGLDELGRPVRVPGMVPTREGTIIAPGNQGGTNWYSPSYSPLTGLFYIPSWVNYTTQYVKQDVEYVEGRIFGGGAPRSTVPGVRAGQLLNYAKEDEGYGAVRAIDPKTGELKWEFKMTDFTDAGVLTTASHVLFSGGREGYFFALDARTGSLLWRAAVGGRVVSGPMTYAVGGRQYVAVAAGNALFSFALRP